MCKQLDLQTLRMQSYTHLMRQAANVAGVSSILTVNLQLAPSVRALTAAGRLDKLRCLIASASRQAVALGLLEAVRGLRARQGELTALEGELKAFQLPTVDVAVLDPDWGKRGRGAKIVAWIAARGATPEMVMERFQLARSTSQRYIRQARKAVRLAQAA
jgi:hypothetical protein